MDNSGFPEVKGVKMRIAKVIVAVLGVVLGLMGLVWMGQGSGYFPYPAGNPMIDQTPWVWRGAVVFLVGLGAIWYSRRL